MDIDDVAATSGEATAEAVVEACAQAGAEASTQACAEASADATATVDGEPDREDEIVVYGLSKWQTGKSLKDTLKHIKENNLYKKKGETKKPTVKRPRKQTTKEGGSSGGILIQEVVDENKGRRCCRTKGDGWCAFNEST
jgi:hypothetical protein